MSLTTPDVIALLILDVLFIFFAIISFFLSIRIVKNWDISSTSSLQYSLEKQSYLVATVIKYLFFLKLPLFIYFVFTLDLVANVIPGAMCAAGVVNATPYGFYLFIIKIINLYLFGIWLALHHYDIQHPDYPYTKLKFAFFIVIFFLFMAEITLELMMFSAIDPHVIVSCCGTLFCAIETSHVSSFLVLPEWVILSVFYGSFILLFIFYYAKKIFFFALANILYLATALISLIAFFSTYVYELPTHNCPFCLLQSDYYYIGYLFYSSLFIGTFFGVGSFVINAATREKVDFWFKLSMLFNLCYLVLVSLYPVIFYLKNGVWL